MLAVRVLSQVTENTVYSYALLLAVYLLGTALGAALLQARKPAANDATESTLIQGLAAAILLGGATLWWSDVICAWSARTFGASALTALAGEALAAVAAMLAPTLMMGALAAPLFGLALSLRQYHRSCMRTAPVWRRSDSPGWAQMDLEPHHRRLSRATFENQLVPASRRVACTGSDSSWPMGVAPALR